MAAHIDTSTTSVVLSDTTQWMLFLHVCNKAPLSLVATAGAPVLDALLKKVSLNLNGVDMVITKFLGYHARNYLTTSLATARCGEVFKFEWKVEPLRGTKMAFSSTHVDLLARVENRKPTLIVVTTAKIRGAKANREVLNTWLHPNYQDTTCFHNDAFLFLIPSTTGNVSDAQRVCQSEFSNLLTY